MFALALATMAVLAASAPGAAPQVTKDPTNTSIGRDARPLPVHIGGRVATSPLQPPAPKGAQAYVHQWPAIYWEAAFAGDRLLLRFDDDQNEYRLTVDDAAPLPIAQPGRAEMAVTGLDPDVTGCAWTR